MVKSLVDNQLDETDQMILEVLQEKGNLSNVQLAKRINLSPPATHARVKRLENEGYIDQYVSILNREKLGYDLLCFIFIKTNAHQIPEHEEFQNAVHSMPEVLECHHITGDYDYLLKVVIKNSKDLKRFVLDRLSTLSSIGAIQTSISYEEVKSITVMPIPK